MRPGLYAPRRAAAAAALLASLFLCAPSFGEEGGERSVIRIESAQKTEYKKDKESGNDAIVLTGNVRVSVTQGGTTTTIRAERVNYSRSSDMLYAEGNVSLEQSTGGTAGGETVTAASLLFNTATLEGVFDDGRAVQTSSDAINLPSGSTLIVSSDIFGRDSGGTISFKSGSLTFCDEEDPHWRIRATRIWLLPGGEFAFLNAVLFVGRVPLLWLPAFYYPKDELVFNPAFGYRKRTGYYFNTTTYIYGRKAAKKEEESSSSEDDDDEDKINFFSLMNTSAMKEQVREGLVLHNLDADFKGDTSSYAKVMADYYANLGVMAGFDAAFAPGGALKSVAANLELGFSGTVFKRSGEYIPYNSAGDEVSDRSELLGLSAPFRYRGNLKLVFERPLTLTVSLPVYSDPFFTDDFGTRAESMDWISFAMNGMKDDEGEEKDPVEISSFTWDVGGSWAATLPKSVSPLVSSAAVSSFSTSVVFSSRATADDVLKSRDEYKADSDWKTYTPERKFYYPSQVTPLKTTWKVAGTLLQYPAEPPKPEKAERPSLSAPAELRSGERRPEDGLKKEGDGGDGEKPSPVLPESALPALNAPKFSPRDVDTLSYTLGYSVTPAFTSQVSYASANLSSAADFRWSDVLSTYVNASSPVELSSELGWKDGFVSLKDKLAFEPVYQSHPYLKEYGKGEDGKENGGYTDASRKSIEDADKGARRLDFSSVNELVVKPFVYTETFAATSLAWNSTMKLVKTEFEAADEKAGTAEAFSFRTAEFWNDDCFTVHNVVATLAAKEGGFSQSLELKSSLPPLVDAYHGSLSLGFPLVTLTAGTGIKQKSKDEEEWVKEDFTQSATVSVPGTSLKLTQSYTYDLEEEENESFKIGLSGYGATVAYTMSNVAGYEFGVERDAEGRITKRSGWKARPSTEKEFQSFQLSVSYTNPSRTFKYVGERISLAPGLSASLVYDFLRPTNSYLTFKPSVTFRVNEFLDVTFSAESRNSVVYRYFCPEDDYEFYYAGKGERSFWRDMAGSFRLDDDDMRKESGFKMKSVSVKLTHDLDDWDLSCSLKVAPRYLSTEKRYDFSPYFSLSVAWRPLAGMKTKIVDDYGEWKLNP